MGKEARFAGMNVAGGAMWAGVGAAGIASGGPVVIGASVIAGGCVLIVGGLGYGFWRLHRWRKKRRRQRRNKQ